jgi:orotidine-5'-phosphate decarboxylase
VPNHHLAFALDFPSLADARPYFTLSKHIRFAKIGLELFCREGPTVVQQVADAGFHVFLDLKLHDIPATVERAVDNLATLGIHLLTVHTFGGPTMLSRAVQAAQKSGTTQIVGVTVLTSLDTPDLSCLGIDRAVADQTERLAKMAWQAGVRAFVCSPKEVAHLRSTLGSDALLITPGIRPAAAATQDQKRVATPASAIADGADILVVGRPIRDAQDPEAATLNILAQINQSLASKTIP